MVLALQLVLLSCTPKKQIADAGREKPGNGKKELSYAEDQRFREIFHEANKHLSTANYQEAFEQFLAALQINPDCGACHYQLSALYNYQGRPSLAINAAKTSIQLEPENEWYNLQLALLYQSNGLHEDAVTQFIKLRKLNPYKADYLFPLAESQLRLGRNKDALNTFEEAERILGTSPELSMQKHGLYMQIGEDQKAIDELEKLIEAYPGEISYLGILAEAYEEMGNPEKALETYERLLEKDPQNGLVRLSLYDYFRYHGDSERAKKELRIAMTSEDVPIDAKMQVMMHYFAQSESNQQTLAEAYDLLSIMDVVDSNESKMHTIYGDFLYRDGKKDLALERYRKAVQLDPDHFAIWNQVMLIESELQRFDTMLVDSKLANELFPNQPSFYFFNGLANLQLGQPEEAIEILNIGKEYVIDNDDLLSEFYQNIAQAHHDLKQHQESDKNFDKALTYDPNNAYVMNNYAYYLSLRKEKLDQAAAMSKRSNELIPGSASFMDTYGWILFQQEKYEDAEIWLSKAMNFGGKEDGTVLEHYGDVLFMLNKTTEALDYWKQAKEKGGASDQIDQKIQEKRYIE